MSDPKMVGRFEVCEFPNGTRIYFDPGPHRYYSQIKPSTTAKGGYSYVKGSNVAGASTVAKFIDPPGDQLLYWAAGLDQVGISELADRDLKAGADLTWLADPDRIKARLREEEATWAHVRDRSAVRGTNIHEFAMAELAAGRVPDLSSFRPDERAFAQAVIRWWRERQPDVIAAEQMTFSEKLGYGGRFDLLAVFEVDGVDTRVLVDAKTREKGKVRMTDFVQLAGYEQANVECGVGSSGRQMALILLPDGTFREEWSTAVAEDFNAALDAYKRNRRLAGELRAAANKREVAV